jgi:hypothetical protein
LTGQLSFADRPWRGQTHTGIKDHPPTQPSIETSGIKFHEEKKWREPWLTEHAPTNVCVSITNNIALWLKFPLLKKYKRKDGSEQEKDAIN